MIEYLIASLKCMPSVFMTCKKASFVILVEDSLLETMDWTGSKAVAISASKICVLLQMVHGGRRKSIPTKMTLIAIHMDVSFVLNPFLFYVFAYERSVLIAWCAQFIMIDFYDYIFAILIYSLIGS